MLDTRPMLMLSDFPEVTRSQLETLQVNLGYKCNLSCTHCHVAAGPTRTELMDKETIDTLLDFIDRQGVKSLDLTGGAPEMNPHFKYFVEAARKRDVHVIDRCNLTILLEPGYEDMAEFLARHKVEVVASLPCYTKENVDKQRGKGVYDHSIEALFILNRLGFGIDSSDLMLNLVYNPGGAFLPPSQGQLEIDYKQELSNHFGISFNRLLTITNMPISRFGSVLLSKGQFHDYMSLLKSSYSSQNMKSVMCRNLISVDWQGYVYDCDFNQMLEIPLIASDRPRTHISELLDTVFLGQAVKVADHCYGCTAGQGSSCGGAFE